MIFGEVGTKHHDLFRLRQLLKRNVVAGNIGIAIATSGIMEAVDVVGLHSGTCQLLRQVHLLIGDARTGKHCIFIGIHCRGFLMDGFVSIFKRNLFPFTIHFQHRFFDAFHTVQGRVSELGLRTDQLLWIKLAIEALGAIVKPVALLEPVMKPFRAVEVDGVDRLRLNWSGFEGHIF